MNILELARRDMDEMIPYEAAPPRNGRKLDCNESPFGLPDTLRRRLAEWLEKSEDLNRYPESDNTELREAIAGLWGVAPENITCGVGSDQLIDIMCRVFLDPGDTVLTLAPTFGMYTVSALLNHGRVATIPVGEPARGIVKAAKDAKAKILFICSPNNPTGQSMPERDIRFVLDNVSCVVALDEAYGEFSGQTMIPWIDEYPNMIVLRTFSKSFGLAGIRVGYAVASREAIGLLDIARPPFNLTTISQRLATWAIYESEEYASRTKKLVEYREQLYGELKKIPEINVSPSDANFVYVTSRLDIASILEGGGVLVRRYPKKDGLYRVRISAGTPEENQKVGELLCDASRK
jgi:histidinol-phosphate aminotransferase